MPKISLPVPGTQESVVRPVVLDIARTVLHETGLPESTLIYYPGDLERTLQQGSSINTKEHDVAKFPFSSQITIEVDETYEADRMLSTAVLRPENYIVFRDDKLETLIKPSYSSTEMTLNFKFRAKDKTTAVRWRDDIRARTSMERAERVHSVKYHYLIPPAYIKILEEIHRMRENVAPYGEDFDTWFKNNRSTRVHELTNQAGQQGRWGVAETQARIIGWFDFEGVPELGSKEDDADTWTISFSYKFRYDKPISCVMMYPLMIHNQLMDQKYRPGPDEQPYAGLDRVKLAATYSADHFGYFETGNDIIPIMLSMDGYSIPEFDEFLPSSVVVDTRRIYTVMLSLDSDPTKIRQLMNLNELVTLAFDEDVMCCLRKEWRFMTKPLQSIFVLSLYRSDQLQRPDILSVDQDLNVTSTVDLSYREYYHIRLGLVKNWRTVHPQALERLRTCGKGLTKIIDTLDPTLKHQDKLPCMIDDNYIPKKCLYDAIDEMNKNIIVKGIGDIIQHNRVETLFITAAKNADR